MFNQKRYEILKNMDEIKGITLREYWEQKQNFEYERFCFIDEISSDLFKLYGYSKEI